jgi:gliding motility-associated-like protein
MVHLSDIGSYSILIEVPCISVSDFTTLAYNDSCFVNHDIYIPNIFSPNGDGINDLFSVFVNASLDVLAMQTTIFDRWGNMVFDSEEIPGHWKGDFNGVTLNPAVFVYRIVIRYKDRFTERTEVFSGDVTLMR